MLELACFTAASAIAAAKAGAHRLELCADYAAGGTTPLLSTLHAVRRETTVPINVMIRPRGGEFVYSDAEFAQMKHDVEVFKEAGVQGFVLGVLEAGGLVDRKRCGELVQLARPVPCTFHRAIDEAEDLDMAVEVIINVGFTSILTSGGVGTATEGVGKVKELQGRYGKKVSFILGGGVRSTNVVGLKEEAGVQWMHSAAITGEGEEVDEQEVARMTKLLHM